MKKVILAGNAITAEILAGYIAKDNRYELVGLTVDDDFAEAGGIQGFATTPLSKLKQTIPAADCSIIMAMGYNDINRSRESMFIRLKEMGYSIETYVHQDARVYTNRPLGEGCIILPSAVIEPHAFVGLNTMIWCNATLAHHCTVEAHCWIASGAVLSGQAKVERNSFIGVNATIVNEVTVGEFCIIGGGALITKNTKPSSVHLARSGEQVRFNAEEYVKYVGI